MTESKDPLTVAIEALQNIDSIAQVLLEGGYGKDGDRKAYRQLAGLAQTWIQLKRLPAPRAAANTERETLPAYSCAKRANDPSNEFAACRKWCGDKEKCVRPLDQALVQQYLSALDDVPDDVSFNSMGWNINSPELWEAVRIYKTEQQARAALSQPAKEQEQKPVATVRVANKGYSMELSTYVAYALPEGMHDLFAAPVQQEAKPEIRLPERVIDTLWQAAGLSTYHPDGSQLEKLYEFAHGVTAEVLARLPAPVQAEAKWCKVCERECTQNTCSICGTMTCKRSQAEAQSKDGGSEGGRIE